MRTRRKKRKERRRGQKEEWEREDGRKESKDISLPRSLSASCNSWLATYIISTVLLPFIERAVSYAEFLPKAAAAASGLLVQLQSDSGILIAESTSRFLLRLLIANHKTIPMSSNPFPLSLGNK